MLTSPIRPTMHVETSSPLQPAVGLFDASELSARWDRFGCGEMTVFCHPLSISHKISSFVLRRSLFTMYPSSACKTDAFQSLNQDVPCPIWN